MQLDNEFPVACGINL